MDTAWLLCGVLHAREHFDKGRIRRLANEIIGRVDWQWMRAEGDTLCHGWTPENGFLPYRWDEYSELLAMYLLAIGSTYASHPGLELGCMDAAESDCRDRRHVRRIRAPLYSCTNTPTHGWISETSRTDGRIIFDNSRVATMRHREFCIHLKNKFPWFGENMWGISASDSRYRLHRLGWSQDGGEFEDRRYPRPVRVRRVNRVHAGGMWSRT